MEISNLLDQLIDPSNTDALKISDILAKNGSKETVLELIKLLKTEDENTKIIIARTLSEIDDNQVALEPLLEAIDEFQDISGDLMVHLEGFDLSLKYVTIFKYWLFGTFKMQSVAEDLLDYKEFDITHRVLKKANKAWSHYQNNIKQDDAFELKKEEVEELLEDLKLYLESQ